MLVLLAALNSAGCFSSAEGIHPPSDRVYFPTGLALVNASRAEGASHLLVANSDYDLQFNAGTLQSLNLDRARAWIPLPCATDADCAGPRPGSVCDVAPTDANGGVASFWCVASSGEFAGRPCGPVAERPLRDQLLHPGRCAEVELASPPDTPGDDAPFLTSSVRIGAFATDALFRERPASSGGDSVGRVLVPVRGDATLHWADVLPDGSIDCGQQRNRGTCDDAHRAGNDPDTENTRDLRLAPEPFAIAASTDGEAVLVSHQTTGRVSLFVNDWDAGEGPRLEFTLPDLPLRPVGIAAVPPPAIASPSLGAGIEHLPGFLVTFRNASPPQVHLLRYFPDSAGTTLARPFLSRAGVVGIDVNSSGIDSRGIAVDARARSTAESACGETLGVTAECSADAACFSALPEATRTGYLDCLERAAATPLDVYVANRSPTSLVIGRTVPIVNDVQSSELPRFDASEALTQGPSRVLVGQVVTGTTAEKALETRVFVVCFESRRIFVYDPLRRRFELEITTGLGPHAVAVDANAGHLYVSHFTDSYVGVFSLDQRFPRSYGKMLATFGRPTAPRASK